MFKHAIVKKPCKNLVNGITKANLGLPNYKKALSQHDTYIEALEDCGLKVIILEPDEDYPDSTFVEDTAVLTKDCAIITNPGAESRKGEIDSIKNVICQYYDSTEEINFPGTLDGGDLMMVGDHFYIGLSERTNTDGAFQLISILEKYGMTGSTIKLEKVLHLKTGVNYIEKNNMLVCGEFLESPELKNYNLIEVLPEESYAANSLWINDTVIVPKGFPKTLKMINENGYQSIEVDVSEFQKIDGGLSCLSLRF